MAGRTLAIGAETVDDADGAAGTERMPWSGVAAAVLTTLDGAWLAHFLLHTYVCIYVCECVCVCVCVFIHTYLFVINVLVCVCKPGTCLYV